MNFNEYYQNILLEKDHRQKMLKFGIPSEVADYLHSIDDKYSLWFANQIKNMEGYKNSKNKVNWIQTNLLTDINGILDWVKNIPNVFLKTYDWNQAVEEQQKYHQNIQTKSLEGVEKNKIIKKYSDGFYWVDLESDRCTEEASSMGHCASTRADTLFSLRKFSPETQSIESFITIGASPDEGVWTQCKGKRNSFPKEIYHKYIADILVSNNMLKYKSEYDAKNDFTSAELKKYIEENPEQFENSDELLEVIEEGNISFKDFEKHYKENEIDKMKHFSIYLDEYDYDEFISHRVSVYFSVPLEKFGDYSQNVRRYIQKDNPYDGEDSPKSRTILGDVIFHRDYYFNYSKVTVDDNSVEMMGDIEDSDSSSSLTDEGLNNFIKFCNFYKNEDERFDEEKYYERFLQFLISEGVLPEEDDLDPDSEGYIKPIPPEDPRQMKFDFMSQESINSNIIYKSYYKLLTE